MSKIYGPKIYGPKIYGDLKSHSEEVKDLARQLLAKER